MIMWLFIGWIAFLFLVWSVCIAAADAKRHAPLRKDDEDQQ